MTEFTQLLNLWEATCCRCGGIIPAGVMCLCCYGVKRHLQCPKPITNTKESNNAKNIKDK